MLEAAFTPAFKKDLKRLDKKHIDTSPLELVIELVLEDSTRSLDELKRRHRMHKLRGNYEGCSECHVCNYGDWLLVWRKECQRAVLLRTGKHDEIF